LKIGYSNALPLRRMYDSGRIDLPDPFARSVDALGITTTHGTGVVAARGRKRYAIMRSPP